jgi:hypothetical protein
MMSKMPKCPVCKTKRLTIIDEAMACSHCKQIVCADCRKTEHECGIKHNIELKSLEERNPKILMPKLDII